MPVTPPEGTRKPTPLDKDFIHPPTPAEMVQEDEKLRQAVASRDYATFYLWLEKNEREAKADPKEHAELLVRAARIFNGAGNSAGAVEYLLKAAKVAKAISAESGDRSGMEEGIAFLLREFGGEEAVTRLAETLQQEAAALKEVQRTEADASRKSELAEVSERNASIQQELIALGAHDWKTQPAPEGGTYGEIYNDAEREARRESLKEKLKEITKRRAELMQK